jgi:hypothetical protein
MGRMTNKGCAQMPRKGWKHEPARHALAARGIKTKPTSRNVKRSNYYAHTPKRATYEFEYVVSCDMECDNSEAEELHDEFQKELARAWCKIVESESATLQDCETGRFKGSVSIKEK